MTDTDKLKRLKREINRKEFWRETRDSRDYVIDEICDADDYGAEERYIYSDWLRDSILALIAENERLNGALKDANDGFEKHERLWYLAKDERDEAVALLRLSQTYVSIASCESGDMAYNRARDCEKQIVSFLARIDAAG